MRFWLASIALPHRCVCRHDAGRDSHEFLVGGSGHCYAYWWDPRFEQRIKVKLEIEEFRDKAQALIAGMERRPSLGLEGSRLCHFLSFWKPIWGDVAYIIMVRNPVDVARS